MPKCKYKDTVKKKKCQGNMLLIELSYATHQDLYIATLLKN